MCINKSTFKQNLSHPLENPWVRIQFRWIWVGLVEVLQFCWVIIVTLLLEWQPKVVTIARRALYQHTTMVSRPNRRILIRRVGTRHHYRLTRACQDAKGKVRGRLMSALGTYTLSEREVDQYMQVT